MLDPLPFLPGFTVQWKGYDGDGFTLNREGVTRGKGDDSRTRKIHIQVLGVVVHFCLLVIFGIAVGVRVHFLAKI